MDGSISLAAAHAIADRVEQAIAAELPGSDVTVHSEPGA